MKNTFIISFLSQFWSALTNQPYPSVHVDIKQWQWEWDRNGNVKYNQWKTLWKYTESKLDKLKPENWGVLQVLVFLLSSWLLMTLFN